jgi:chitodextrinase
MVNLANYEQMIYMAPFQTQYFSAYLTYDDSLQNMTPAQMFAAEGAQASQNLQQAIFTPTAVSFYNSIVTPADAVPPSTPAGLTGGSSNPTTASLTWNASTDNVGVAGYRVLRDGNSVAQTALQTFQDSGLTEATTYKYAIEAFDLAGNVSAPTAPFSVQTKDTTPPSPPGNVTAHAVSCFKATLNWTASSDNSGVAKYLVFWGTSPRTLSQIGTAWNAATTYSDGFLSAATTNYFGVEAVDKGGNISYMSSIVAVTTPALPVAPHNLLATPDSTTRVTLTWSPSTGGLPIARYMVYRGSSPSSLSQTATVLDTSFTDTSVIASTKYYYAVQAADSGTPPAQSGLSTPVAVTTYGYPSVPANLVATPLSSSKIGLTWSASKSGGLPIADYHVYRGASPSGLTQVGITTGTSYTNVSLTAGTKYYYAVQAGDTGGNLSLVSPAVAATTQP